MWGEERKGRMGAVWHGDSEDGAIKFEPEAEAVRFAAGVHRTAPIR